MKLWSISVENKETVYDCYVIVVSANNAVEAENKAKNTFLWEESYSNMDNYNFSTPELVGNPNGFMVYIGV